MGTHFRLEEPVPQPAERKVAVLAHGVGTSNALFDGMVTSLWKAGYTTLRFDFLGHGWSVADELWIRYDKDVFLAQLEDLLLHVLGPAGTVACFVGHSTGGALGVYAAACLRWKMDDLVLVSPCLWKHAPLIVRVGDAMPEVLWRLLQSSLVQKLNLPTNAYLENCDTAFGKGADGKYVHPDAHAKASLPLSASPIFSSATTYFQVCVRRSRKRRQSRGHAFRSCGESSTQWCHFRTPTKR